MEKNVDRKRIFKSILLIAIPSIITNVTTPLLGMTDVAIAGHLGSAVFVAAIAVGGNMFNLLYWLFGFLRMGSSGIAAQKFGAHDIKGVSMVLSRALFISSTIGVIMICLSSPIKTSLLDVMEVESATRSLALSYFDILIWGAPAVLGSFAITGWFIGMQDTRSTMFISIVIDIVNILASLTLVFTFGLGVQGLAYGTLIAQWLGFIIGIFIAVSKHRFRISLSLCALLEKDIISFFRVNVDIFLRTLCLVGVTLWFTRSGSLLGTEYLAVNALLLQFFSLFSFFMDGFANAGEALCGKFKGAHDRDSFITATTLLLRLSFVIACSFTLLYFLFGNSLIKLLSDDAHIISLSHEFFWWAVTIPIAGFMAFSYDGIFIGVTETKSMLLSVAISSTLFFIIYFLTVGQMENHGLWLAFLSYLLSRGIILHICSKKFKSQSYFP